jgi:hypothetical protein
MFDYLLEENLLTEAPDDFRAQVVNVTSYSEADIEKEILGSGAGLTESDVKSVLTAYNKAVYKIVANGGAVHTELFNAFPSIPGVFNSATDTFDAHRHKVKINLHAGVSIQKAVAEVRTHKVTTGIVPALILAVTDVKTGSVSHLLTPNRPLRINGSKLKIAGDNTAVGVYFVEQGTGQSYKVDPSDVVTNNPSELLVIIPGLAAGTYKVQVTTQFTSGATLLNDPRTIIFDKVLTVE